MYKNYEERVKDFIIDMNNPETKIEIKDYEQRINNPKTELSTEKEIQKPFIFKGYTTEADRIKDSVERNRYLYNLPDYEEILNRTPNKKDGSKKTEVNSPIDKRKSNTNIIKGNNDKNNYKKIMMTNTNKKKNIRGFSESEINKYKYILKNDLIMQPEMRFKPRTDLERVYDMINAYKYGKVEKGILDKQLRKFKYKNRHELQEFIKEKIREANKIKNVNINRNRTNLNNSYEENNSNSNSNINSIDTEEHYNKKNKLYFDPKDIDYNLKPWMKIYDLNKDANKLLNSYHFKTHFKAAKEIAANKINMKINNSVDLDDKKNSLISLKRNKNSNEKRNEKSCLLLPNLFPKKYIINKSATEGNKFFENNNTDNTDIYNNTNDLINIKIEKNDDDKIFNNELDKINKEGKEDFNNIYKKSLNPFKKNITYDENKIKLLNDIAFQKNEEIENIKEDNNNDYDNNINEEIKINNNNDNNNIIDENHIIIGNEILNKNEQFDIITNKILDNCNILKHKSKFNNNILKKRKGKLMITHGLSVDQFEQKYKFKK